MLSNAPIRQDIHKRFQRIVKRADRGIVAHLRRLRRNSQDVLTPRQRKFVRQIRDFALAITLPLALHSTDHAHVLMGGSCWGGEQVALSVPTTDDARVIALAIDRDIRGLEFRGEVWVVGVGEQAKEPVPEWCGP